MPDGILAKDVKFLGIVTSFNEMKKFGMVASEEAQAMWGMEIYAFKDVLESAGASVGDTIRFGVHVNPKGMPQVSLPIFKVGEDGYPVGIPEGSNFVNCEEMVVQDPSFLEKLKSEIEGRSSHQNLKRAGWGDNGKGMKKGCVDPWGKGAPADAWGKGAADPWGKGAPADPWGKGAPADPWGKGKGKAWGGESWGGESYGAGAGWGQEVVLYATGIPAGVEQRELAHIFRQYAGYSSLRIVHKEDHSIAFVTFSAMQQAKFAADALTGYTFDENDPTYRLQLAPAQPKGAGKGKGAM